MRTTNEKERHGHTPKKHKQLFITVRTISKRVQYGAIKKTAEATKVDRITVTKMQMMVQKVLKCQRTIVWHLIKLTALPKI